MTSKIKAVIFDLDGTLVDSEFFHFECWNEVLKLCNQMVSYKDYIMYHAGISSPLNAIIFKEKYKLNITSEVLSKLKEKITENKLKTEDIKLMPSSIKTLEYFYKLKTPIFLVTGSSRNDLESILEKVDIKKYFKFSITRNDVKKSKPHPESYLKAIEKGNFNPEDFLVFEDSKGGVESAKSSGITCFAIQKIKELHPRLAQADKIFDNFDNAIFYLENENLI
jgi:HAD superfamily hydrolase (TIGR01509 family)